MNPFAMEERLGMIFRDAGPNVIGRIPWQE